MPLALIAAILAIGGAPSDTEAAAAGSGLACVACLWVAAALFRRWWIKRHIPRVTEADHLLPWMLMFMVIIKICLAALLLYRAGSLLAITLQSASWETWFQENRSLGAAITVALAAAMAALLRYPLQRSFGRCWVAIVGCVGVLVFFAVAYLPRWL
jgi:hypothetical protein